MHLVGVHVYAYFWHRFGEAFGSNFPDVGFISGYLLGSFCNSFRRCCKINNWNFAKRKDWFLRCRASAFAPCLLTFECFVYVVVWTASLFDLRNLAGGPGQLMALLGQLMALLGQLMAGGPGWGPQGPGARPGPRPESGPSAPLGPGGPGY